MTRVKYEESLLLEAFRLRFKEEKATTEIAESLNINKTYLRELFWGKQRAELTEKWNLLCPEFPVRKIKHPSGIIGLNKIKELRDSDPTFEKKRAEAISLSTDPKQRSKVQKDRMKDIDMRERISKGVAKAWDARSFTVEIKYPLDFKFTLRIKLPAFVYGCNARTKIIQKKLSKLSYPSHHHPDDFIVEKVEVTDHGEIWHLGS